MSLHYSVTPVGCRWVSDLRAKPPIIQSLVARCHCCLVGLGLSFSLILSPAATAAAAASTGTKLAEQVQTWRGQHHQAAQPLCTLITKQQRWSEIWEQIGQSPPREWPQGARAVVALDAQRPSGGYDLAVRWAAEGRLVVESRPPEGPASAVMTRPWLVMLFAAGGVRSVACSFPE